MKRYFLAVLTATCLVLFGGAAMSGNTITGPVVLHDFDQASGALWASPMPNGSASEFWHSSHTVHLPGPGPKLYPPSPCRGLAIAHDLLVTRFVDSVAMQPAMLAIMRAMAKEQCNAIITRDTSNQLTSFQPTP